MKNKQYAILMEKTQLSDKIFAVKPIKVIEGTQIEGKHIFIDKLTNTVYCDVLTSHIGINDSNHFYSFVLDEAQLKESFTANSNKEMLENYYNYITQYVYIGVVSDDDKNITLHYMPDEVLKQILYKNIEEAKEDSDNQNDTQYDIILPDYAIETLLEFNNIDDIKTVLRSYLLEEEMVNPSEFEEYTLENVQEEKNIAINKIDNDDKLLLEKPTIDVLDMYNYIKSRVIGQDEAIKTVITKFITNYNASFAGQDYIPTRILLTGSTGSGKTMILDTMLEYLKDNCNTIIPMVKPATSQLTQAGYVGMNIEDVLVNLLNSAPNFKNLLKKIEYVEKRGVIYFDEIDKKGSSRNSDVAGRGVLNSLLQFLDGSDYCVYDSPAAPKQFYMNTKYLHMFFTAAFTDVNKDVNAKVLGFNSSNIKEINLKKPNYIDYVSKGLMTEEFMGRIYQIVNLNPLNSSTLENILRNSKKSPLLTSQALLKNANVNLEFTDDFVKAVAMKAYNLKLGARSLQSVVEDALKEVNWQGLISDKKIDILVSEDTVNDPKVYKIK